MNPAAWSEEITAFIEGGFRSITEQVTDSIISGGRDGHTFFVVWSRGRPANNVQATDFCTAKSMSIRPNPMRRKLTPSEVVEFERNLVKGDRYDARSTADYIAVRSARLAGYKAWVVPTDHSHREEHPTDVLFERGDLVLYALTTANQIRTEGAALKHCVGNPGQGYLTRALQGAITLLSVRTRAGEPLATAEVEKGQVVQMASEHNGTPPAEARALVEEYLAQRD